MTDLRSNTGKLPSPAGLKAHAHPSFQNLTGNKYGRLFVVGYSGVKISSGGNRRGMWECQCECGKTINVSARSLKHGNTKSCGCLRRENKQSFKHGCSRRGQSTREYRIWSGMRKRCTNPSAIGYIHYGGRGITICERWQSFENFLSDMGTCPPGLSIERINNAMGYFPENCRWATQSEQMQNTRSTKFITINGITRQLAEWASINGIKIASYYARLKMGWTIERAITQPTRKCKQIL